MINAILYPIYSLFLVSCNHVPDVVLIPQEVEMDNNPFPKELNVTVNGFEIGSATKIHGTNFYHVFFNEKYCADCTAKFTITSQDLFNETFEIVVSNASISSGCSTGDTCFYSITTSNELRGKVEEIEDVFLDLVDTLRKVPSNR